MPLPRLSGTARQLQLCQRAAGEHLEGVMALSLVIRRPRSLMCGTQLCRELGGGEAKRKLLLMLHSHHVPSPGRTRGV